MRRILCTSILLCIFSFSAYPQTRFFENGQSTRTGPDAGLFPDTPTRMKVDLAGRWGFSLDGQQWHEVSIPAAYDWTGKVVFQRKFKVSPEMLDKYTFSLVSYGINYQSEVSVNGNFIGRHTGGYSSFVFPIPLNTLQVGDENTIRISVDNELNPRSTIPLRHYVGGWRTYGGIFRDIYVLGVPKLAVEDVQAKILFSSDRTSATVAVRAEVTDRGSGLKPEQNTVIGLQVEAFDKLNGTPAGQSQISPLVPQTNKTITASAQLVLGSPRPWSPDNPDLYVLKCRLVRVFNKVATVIDEYDADIGVRDLRWSEGKLFINNVPTPLKGVLWQEDHPSFGSAMTYDAMERDVAIIKALGANLVRFLYPPHPYMLNLCDRYGLLVFEEIPLVGVPSEILSQEYLQDQAINYVKEMVGRDRHHVALVAWGIGDQFETSSPTACEYVNNARNVIHSADDRSVYFVTNDPNDKCAEYADLIAVNTYRVDVKEFRDFLKTCKAGAEGKPVIVARYGKNIEPGDRNGYSDPNSMEAQARTISQFYEAIADSKIAGAVLWSFSDWRNDRPALTTHADDPYLQSNGIVSYEREKRPAYDVTRSLFNGEKLQALPIGNYSPSAPIAYVVAGLIVLISFAFLYNSNRRFRECVNRSLFRTYNFFADVRDQRIIASVHSFFLALVVSVTWAIILSSLFSRYRESLFLDNLMSQFLHDSVKDTLVRLIWHPSNFIFVVSLLVGLKLLILILLVRLCSMAVRTRVNFYHAVSITVWSMLPCVILIPVAMIMYRVMESELYVVPVVILLATVIVWVYLRLLKGVSIIYDIVPARVYVVGFLLLALIVGASYGYFEYTRSASIYVRYLLHSAKVSV